MNPKLINFLVFWCPTILFVLILLFGFLIGILRGLRRSRTFLIHRLIASAIALALFFVCIYSVAFDRLLLSIIESFGINLHKELNVSSSIDTLKGVLTAGVPALLEETDMALAVALSENSRYILALVNLIYNVIFALICLVIYYFIKFILFICYCLFYPEWKYRKKYKKKVENDAKIKPYKKRRIAGGIIGLCSSFVVAIISFSFLGNILYIAAGTGEKGLAEYSFNDKETREAYQVINTVESYGSKGIFKVLNLAKDKNGIPLYLYPAGFLYSSKMENPDTGEKDRVYFTFEMGNYTNFLKQTASIAVEYCGEDVERALANDQVALIDVVKDLLTNKAFTTEFRNLLSSYTEKSSFINEFLFDVIDSYCANIDKSSIANSLSEDASQLLQIMFVKGYTSSVIYFEDLYTNDNTVLPYIKPSDLISKKDLLVVYDIFTDLVSKGLLDEYSVDDIDKTVDMIVSACSHLEELKVFNSKNANKKNINGVMGRLYSYAEIKLLGVSSTETKDHYAGNLDIKWTDEIIALADTAKDIQVLYNRVKLLDENQASTRECFSGIFDDANVVKSYDNVVDYVSNSLLVGRVVSSNFVFGELEALMTENISTEFVKPKNLTYNNYVDEKGSIVHGELYNFMVGLKRLGSDTNTRELLINIIDTTDANILTLVKNAEDDLLSIDSNQKSTVDYFKSSSLLRSIASCYLIDLSSQEESSIYIPDVSKEIDAEGNVISIIKKDEFDFIIDSLFTENGVTDSKDYGFISLIPDGLDIEDDDILGKFFDGNDNLFENRVINNLIYNSPIIQGSFGRLIIANQDTLGDTIKLPNSLQEAPYWVAEYKVENDEKVLVKQSEAVKVFEALHELFENSKELKDIDAAFDKVLKSDKLPHLNYSATNVTSIYVDGVGVKENVTGTEVIYNSLFIRTTISAFVCDNVPEDMKNDGLEAAKDSSGNITVDEFSAIIELLDFLDIEDISSPNAFDVIDNYLNDVEGIILETPYGIENSKNAKLLDLIYQSSPVKYYFSDIVDDAFVTAIGDTDEDVVKLDYVKENNIYTYEQSLDIVNCLVVCDVEKTEEANDRIVQAFQDFNEQITHDDYPSVIQDGAVTTRLDILYSSDVMVILLTDALQEQIQSNDLLQDHPDAWENVVCAENAYSVYKDYEVEQLVMFLDGKSIDDSSTDKFDASHIEIQRVRDDFFDANSKQCNSKLLLSSISINVIENEAVTSGTLIIPNNSIAEIVDYKVLVDAELYNVLSLACDLGIRDVDSFNDTFQDNSNLKVSEINNYVQVDVQDTDIIRATVSSKIIDSSALTLSTRVLDDSPIYNDCSVIKAVEMASLFDIIEEIGVEDMQQVDSIDFDTRTLSDANRWMNDSQIIHETVSSKVLENAKESDSYLIIPTVAKIYNQQTNSYANRTVVEQYISAKDEVTEIDVIRLSELVDLFNALYNIGIPDVSSAYDVDLDGKSITNAISCINESVIIHATVSTKILDNARPNDSYLVIPTAASVYNSLQSRYVKHDIIKTFVSYRDGLNTEVISLFELVNLFEGLMAIGVIDVSDAYSVDEDVFKPGEFDENKINAIAESSVLRATVTKNVKFIDSESSIIPKVMTFEVDFGDEFVDTKLTPNKIAILHDHEVVRLLTSLRTFKNSNNTGSAFTCEFELPHLIELYTNGDLEIILESDIFRVAVSEFLASFNLDKTQQSLYCFETKEVITLGVSTSAVILNYFNGIA